MKFETKYFITENRRFSICFYLIIVDFIISNLLCLELHADFKKIIIIIYLAIILLSIFNLIYQTYSFNAISKEIDKINGNVLGYDRLSNADKNRLYFLEVLRFNLKSKNSFVHVLKEQGEIFHISNSFNYISLVFSLWGFSYCLPFTPLHFTWFFVIIVIFSLLFFLYSVFYDLVLNRDFTGISVGAGVMFYLVFIIGKEGYISAKGIEEIGSFFEKHEYYTNYFVKIRSEDNLSKELTLPANIHAYEQEEYGGEDGNGNDIQHTVRYYSVNRVFLDNKHHLDFYDDRLHLNVFVDCIDQNGKIWEVKLTNVKCK